ncbi:MAG: hypothetical protein ACIAQZ_04765 [Sedimentisphaeraceae bacterium JB056]
MIGFNPKRFCAIAFNRSPKGVLPYSIDIRLVCVVGRGTACHAPTCGTDMINGVEFMKAISGSIT